jgi:hypothetical protein
MNLFSLFAVLLIVTQAPVPATGKTHDNSTKDSQKQNTDADNSKRPPDKISPVIPNADAGGANQKESHQRQDSDNQTTIVVSQPTPVPLIWHWYEIVTWVANLALAGFIIRGVFIALETLRTVKRQTDIQSAAMKQWIDLDGWQSKDLWDGQEPGLKFTFTLINPTNFLLILNHAEIAFSPRLPERYLLVTSGTPLPPNKPLRIDLFLPIDTDRLATFRTGTLGLSVDGTIEFTNALEEKITQTISGLLSCNSTESKLESRIKLHPTVKKG